MATKQIPYGLTDFERIRTANYYYVDKTRYIAEVERNASFFFLIRPRRFGKSLFLNVLRWYYDVNRKDSFEELFGDLYIGSHPTPEQGQYLVLDFNSALLMITVPLVSGSLPTTTNVSSIRASGRKWRVCQMLTRS